MTSTRQTRRLSVPAVRVELNYDALDEAFGFLEISLCRSDSLMLLIKLELELELELELVREMRKN